MAAPDISDAKISTVRLFSEYVRTVQLATNKNDNLLDTVIHSIKLLDLLCEDCVHISEFKRQILIQQVITNNNGYSKYNNR